MQAHPLFLLQTLADRVHISDGETAERKTIEMEKGKAEGRIVDPRPDIGRDILQLVLPRMFEADLRSGPEIKTRSPYIVPHLVQIALYTGQVAFFEIIFRYIINDAPEVLPVKEYAPMVEGQGNIERQRVLAYVLHIIFGVLYIKYRTGRAILFQVTHIINHQQPAIYRWYAAAGRILDLVHPYRTG